MGKRGGPRKELDFEQAEKVAAMGPTRKIFLDFFKIDYKTANKRIKERYGVSLGEFLEQRAAPLKIKLMSVAIEIATKQRNVTMTIFLLKNYCNFSDKREVKQEVKTDVVNEPVKIVLPDQIQKEANKLKEVGAKVLAERDAEAME